MYLKIILFCQLFFLFFYFSSSKTKHNQQFIVEYLMKKDDKPFIEFLKIKLTKGRILEIDLEISEEMENKTIFVQPFNKLPDIGKNKMYETKNATVKDGKKQIKIEEEFMEEYLEGVIIFEYSIIERMDKKQKVCRKGTAVDYLGLN